MATRTNLIFWTALVMAVVLLGAAVSTVRNGIDSGADVAVLALSIAGLVAATTIAGRAVWVVGRAARR